MHETQEKPVAKPPTTKPATTKAAASTASTDGTCEENVVTFLEWFSDSISRALTGSITFDNSSSLNKLPPELAKILDQGDIIISVGMPSYSAGKAGIEITVEVLKGDVKGRAAKFLSMKEADYVRSAVAEAICKPIHEIDNLADQWQSLDREEQLSILEGMVGIE